MEIYLCFIQHLLYSLNDNGKAAIVVPTGFITSKTGIAKKIIQHIVDNGWCGGVVSMPSNIFANTGTNVSVVIIDKSKKHN
jgi:type I restriction enzyme M protein